MIIDCISDLHGFYPQLEGGDLLIIAGDLTATDTQTEYLNFVQWMLEQDYTRIIYIAGNHDNYIKLINPLNHTWYFEDNGKKIDFLHDSITEFEGLKIWGSPWTKTFKGMNPHCKAFALDTEEQLEEKWKMIPRDIDILVTHSPPYGILDRVTRDTFIEGHQCDKIERCGSTTLLRTNMVKINTLKLHVFGHIHESYGKWDIRKSQEELGDSHTPVFVNASHVNEKYQPVNPPIRIIL